MNKRKLAFSILALLIVFTNCSVEKKGFIDEIDTNKSINEIETNDIISFYIENDTIRVRAEKKDFYFKFLCKEGKRIYRKKKFILYPILTETDLTKAQKIIAFNKELKESNLIGVVTKIILIKNKKYLFQEKIGKRLIESNYRREGIILKIDTVEQLLESTKREFFNAEFSNSILQFINSDSLNTNYINANEFKIFKKISNKYFRNLLPNYFYINPITFKIEPIFSGFTINNNLKNKKITTFSSEEFTNYLNYFLEEDSNILTLKDKYSVINQKLLIPKGYHVILKNGDIIDLVNNSSILSFSSFTINGNKNELVEIQSTDSTGQGIHIIQENNSSKINYLKFSNQFSLIDTSKYNHWNLPSAFTIYGGQISVNNCTFKNIKSEDAINFFRCEYEFQNTRIENTFSDAFDADFSNGFISNCKFINSGNDGVDISGGNLNVKECGFSSIKDKAVSAGEKSKLSITNSVIKNSSMGLISKDLSELKSLNNKIINCEIGYCAFQKKGEFGPGEIFSNDDEITNCSVNNLIEYNSSLTINGEKVKVFQNNVIDYLYGKKYGKATFKKN